LISTGGSSLEAVKALRAEGHNVVGVIAIFDYEFPISKENFEKEKCYYHTLSNYSTLIKLYNEENRMSKEDLKLLLDWRHDPQAWAESFKK
jgi:orotate phosphoribosyltransferase